MTQGGVRTARLAAVVFDLDGLLVDSEPLQFRAYREAFSRHGIDITQADWRRWHAAEASVPRWIEMDGLDVDPQQLRAEKKPIYEALIASELSLKPGAEALVRELSGRCPLAVASGSRIESIEACLARFDLRHHFDGCFSATTLPRSKPHPDVYLQALDALDVPAQRSLAIEDSPQGLTAALRAGMRCVVCPDDSHPSPPAVLRDATLVVASLSELDAGILERLLED